MSVIIPNYVVGRQNCLDVSSMYALCCRNTCDDLMTDLEHRLGSSTATYERLSEILAVLPSQTSPVPRTLPTSLLSRFREVEELHGGLIPIHGRLFAQLMHHAFPLECPYPHETAVNPQTHDEWIKDPEERNGVEISEKEMQAYVDNDTCAIGWEGKVECAQENVDLPWSMTEELLSSPVVVPSQHYAPQPLPLAGVALVALGVFVLFTVHLARRGHLIDTAQSRIFQALSSKWLPPLMMLIVVYLAYCADLLDGSVCSCGAVFVIILNVVGHLKKGRDRALPFHAKGSL
jgi:hypothetical protein